MWRARQEKTMTTATVPTRRTRNESKGLAEFCDREEKKPSHQKNHVRSTQLLQMREVESTIVL